MSEHPNVIVSTRKLSLAKKKRNFYSSDEDDSYRTYMSEEQYRKMLGEHIQKYSRRLNNSSPSPAPIRTVKPVLKGSLGPRERKLGNEYRGGSHKVETTSDYLSDIIPQKSGNYNGREFAQEYGISRFVSSSKVYLILML